MNKRGVSFVIFGTLFVLLAVMVSVVLTTLLLFRFFVSVSHPDGIYAAVLTSLYPTAVAFFAFYECILVFIGLSGKQNEDAKGLRPINKPRTVQIPRKVRITVISACAAGIVITAVLGANSYTGFSDKGAEKNFFAVTDSYTWENVRSYSVTCAENDGFDMILTMKDGSTLSFINAINSCTDGFRNEYKDMYGYAVYIDSQLRELGARKNVSGTDRMQEYYEKDYPDVWANISKIISE